MTLIYKGNGRFIPGIPARDLPDDELESIANRDGRDPSELAGELTASGLYKLNKTKRSTKTKTVSAASEDND